MINTLLDLILKQEAANIKYPLFFDSDKKISPTLYY